MLTGLGSAQWTIWPRATASEGGEENLCFQPHPKLRVQLVWLRIYKVVVQPSLPPPSGQPLQREAGGGARIRAQGTPRTRRQSSACVGRWGGASGAKRSAQRGCVGEQWMMRAGRCRRDRPPCRCSGGRGWSHGGGASCQRHRSTAASSARWASTFVASCTSGNGQRAVTPDARRATHAHGRPNGTRAAASRRCGSRRRCQPPAPPEVRSMSARVPAPCNAGEQLVRHRQPAPVARPQLQPALPPRTLCARRRPRPAPGPTPPPPHPPPRRWAPRGGGPHLCSEKEIWLPTPILRPAYSAR